MRIKRAYAEPEATDGWRVLVDRVWPRGLTAAALRLDERHPELGPSTELRRWFGHDPARWEEFRRRYRSELATPQAGAVLEGLAARARDGRVTLVYSAKDEVHNQARVLAEAIEERLGGGGGGSSGRPQGRRPQGGRPASDPPEAGPPASAQSPRKGGMDRGRAARSGDVRDRTGTSRDPDRSPGPTRASGASGGPDRSPGATGGTTVPPSSPGASRAAKGRSRRQRPADPDAAASEAADPGLVAALERLIRAGVAVTTRALAERPAVEVTLQQWRVLVLLDDAGGLRIGAIGARIGQSVPSASRLVGRLEERGLVRSERDPVDGRATLVRVSGRGRRIVRAVADRRRRLIRGAIAPEEAPRPELAVPIVDTLARALDHLA